MKDDTPQKVLISLDDAKLLYCVAYWAEGYYLEHHQDGAMVEAAVAAADILDAITNQTGQTVMQETLQATRQCNNQPQLRRTP